MKNKLAVRCFLIALGIILLDQAIKWTVKLNMELGEEIHLIGEVVNIHFIENDGAAMGLTITDIVTLVGGNMPEETGKLILSLFSIGAVVLLGIILYRVSGSSSLLPYFMAMVLGGATGNIIDRTFYGIWFSHLNAYEGGLFHGQVVDMFYVNVWSGYLPEFLGGAYHHFFPIINLADAAISVGIFCILFLQRGLLTKEEGTSVKLKNDSSG